MSGKKKKFCLPTTPAWSSPGMTWTSSPIQPVLDLQWYLTAVCFTKSTISPSKFEYVSITKCSRQVDKHIFVGRIYILRRTSVRFLGVIIYEYLKYHSQVNHSKNEWSISGVHHTDWSTTSTSQQLKTTITRVCIQYYVP